MKIKSIETFAVAFLLSVSLNTAQAEKAATDKAPAKKAAGKQTDRRADRPTRESIIKRFDKDGDGKLSDTERAAARKAISSRGGRTTDRAPGRISEGLRERYQIAAKKIQEDLKAGKITEEQARQRQQALRKRLQSVGRGGDRDTDRAPGRISEGLRERYQIAAKKIQEDLKAGKITEEQARERQQALRKRLAQSAGRGGDRDTDRSRSSRESLMKEFDKNKDGKLDEAERNALRKAMSERSRSRGGDRRGGERGERSERGRRGGEAAERGGERRRRGGEGAERRRRGNRDRE